MSEKGAAYRDPAENIRRVREWRKAHPERARLTGRRGKRVLQETTAAQDIDAQSFNPILVRDALQDSMFMQPALIAGLIARLTGSVLQDSIAETSRKLVLLGHDILGGKPEINPKGGRRHGNRKTSSLSRASEKDSSLV